MFFSHFKSLCISSYWGWEDGWLVAAVAAASTGSLCIESLSIASSDRSLLGLVLILKELLPHTIKKIALSLHGLAYSFKSSVRCIKTLASIVGSIDIEIRLAVNEDLDLPDDINHAFDILADIATCKSLHMQCEPPLDSHISFSNSALRIRTWPRQEPAVADRHRELVGPTLLPPGPSVLVSIFCIKSALALLTHIGVIIISL
jgi:hypothetical protein